MFCCPRLRPPPSSRARRPTQFRATPSPGLSAGRRRASPTKTSSSLPLGTVTNVATPSGVIVTTTPSAGVVQGGVSGLYAAPYLSGGNGSGFGPGGTDQADGPDATPYITAGSTGANPNSAVTLVFPSLEQYMGILWGSVDTYNTLSLYNGDTLVGTITGSDVIASPDGNQGVDGTVYVNIDALSCSLRLQRGRADEFPVRVRGRQSRLQSQAGARACRRRRALPRTDRNWRGSRPETPASLIASSWPRAAPENRRHPRQHLIAEYVVVR